MWTDLFPFPFSLFPSRFSLLPTVHLSEPSEVSERRTLGMQVRTWLLYECLNRPLCVGRSGGKGREGLVIDIWFVFGGLFQSCSFPHFLLAGNPMSRLAGPWCASFTSCTFIPLPYAEMDGCMCCLISLISWARGGGYHARASFTSRGAA